MRCCGFHSPNIRAFQLFHNSKHFYRYNPSFHINSLYVPISTPYHRHASDIPKASKHALKVADLLADAKQFRSKRTNSIYDNQTLYDAIQLIAKNENSRTLFVINPESQEVVGQLNASSILTHIASMQSMKLLYFTNLAKGQKEEATCMQSLLHLVAAARLEWEIPVVKLAIPSREVLHVSHEDSLEDCRALMTLSGRGELPVLEKGKLLGTVSLTDIAALLYRRNSNSSTASAKSDYINVILPRKGLPAKTSLPESMKAANSSQADASYAFLCFAKSIPHPEKKTKGGEDAYFIATVPDSMESNDAFKNRSIQMPQTEGPKDALCIGVADGVGSWFERNICAKQYSNALMHAARKGSEISFTKRSFCDPFELLHAAWATVLQKEIIGSATACIISLDPNTAELHAVNLGDSGFLIIRDKKSDLETAGQRGTLDGSLSRKIEDRDRDLTPAGRRKGAHVSYRSPQQLHYFNCPYQLGYVDPELGKEITQDLDSNSSGYAPSSMEEKPLFETPENAVRLRVPVLDGDLIVLATDGLFDNVDEETLLSLVNQEPEVEALTNKLIECAYERSLDRMRDSPFARLAKENDLLWSGGIPDDITIVVARVQKKRL